MISTVIQADYPSLAASAERFGCSAQDCAELEQRVRQRYEALIQGGWQGHGAEVFAQEMEHSIFPTMQRLIATLYESRAVILEIVKIMQQAEEEAASLFQADRGNQPDTTQTASAVADSSFWDLFWRSLPGQQGLMVLNAVWSFLAGSGHEFGTEYGPGANIGSLAGDMTSSLLVWGDVRDLLVEGYKALDPNQEVNKLTAMLAAAGLISDLGWLNGPVPDPADGANAGLAVLKTLAKQLDELPKPVREQVGTLIEWGIKHPDRLDDVAEVLQWTLNNHQTKAARPVGEMLTWAAKNSDRMGEALDIVQWTIKHQDSPLGRETLKMLQQGTQDPDWFRKAADASPWIKQDAVRFEQLATDPSQGFKITPKTIQEAAVGLEMEKRGLPQGIQGPISRDTTGGAEFYDASRQGWDVKSFYSKREGSFELNDALDNIRTSLRDKENVIVDTVDMSPQDIDTLRRAIGDQGWEQYILWYP